MADTKPLCKRPFYKKKRWRIAAGIALALLVLNTKVDFSRPIESYVSYSISEPEGFAAYQAKNYEKAFGYVARGVVEKAPIAYAIAGRYYLEGRPPVFLDKCRAFDFFFAAAKLGDVESQRIVAQMFASGEAGYLSRPDSYYWMRRAQDGGYEGAESFLKTYITYNLSAEQLAYLEKLYADRSLDNEPLDEMVEWPEVPYISKWLSYLSPTPVRACQRATIFQILMSYL